MWTANGVEGQIFPPKMASYVAVKLYGPGHVVAYNYIADFHDGINVETYGNPDGSFASGPDIIDGPKYPTRDAGTGGRSPSISTTTTSPTRTTTRLKPTAACTTSHHAEHADQPSVACLLQSADARGTGVLDSKYRVQPAGRLDTAHQRRGRRPLLQQHHRLGDQVAAASNIHWRNNLMLGAELGAGDSERQYVYQLHLVGLQRLPRQSREGRVRMDAPPGG